MLKAYPPRMNGDNINAVAAFTLTVLCMATAIVPASPAGLLA